MATSYWDAGEGEIAAKVTLTEAQQGAPGHSHGGSLAAILDEAMGWAVWRSGARALAGRLEFDYRLPTPLGVPLEARARVVGRGGRSIRAECEMRLPDGSVCVQGRGVFVDLGDRFEEKFGTHWGAPQPGA
ncbi:MAG: PaaI family thioesterase [Candidatus Sericytochromatia bacterium]|uniref:Acyl-coenzyme A thioesterase THEM4 n=1 Tax=Candidatus Tanganyikabacteria bacterium TaxID=2961651 RepID=A0A938BLZ7_9BACT|nr:PaaI family thioesterase [Candidatus Tanganyikabacteria bacterium]